MLAVPWSYAVHLTHMRARGPVLVWNSYMYTWPEKVEVRNICMSTRQAGEKQRGEDWTDKHRAMDGLSKLRVSLLYRRRML